MKRRTLLAGLGSCALALSGCVTGEGSDDENTATQLTDQFESEPTRPECEVESETIEGGPPDDTREYESVETIPYPDPPEEFTEDEVIAFVQDHEEAYIRHDSLCDEEDPERIVGFGYSVDQSWTVDGDALFTVAVVYSGGATSGVSENGDVWMTELGFSGVVYAVDETGAARADVGTDLTGIHDDRAAVEDEIPDPTDDGELVVSF